MRLSKYKVYVIISLIPHMELCLYCSHYSQTEINTSFTLVFFFFLIDIVSETFQNISQC